jgi:hypothetical protein
VAIVPTNPLYLALCLSNKRVSRKSEPSTRLPHLVQGELPLTCQKHRNRTPRSELRDQIALRETLLSNEESQDRNRIRYGNGIVGLLVAFQQQGQQFGPVDGL